MDQPWVPGRIEAIVELLGASEHEFVVCDVGARGGWTSDFQQLSEHVPTRLVAAEPEPLEAQRLSERYPSSIVLPYALGDVDDRAVLKLTRDLGCSSLLEPNQGLLALYPIRSWFEVERRIEIDVRRYESLAEEYDCPALDYVKIDTQGYELQVLDGMGRYLTDVSCIELEGHLLPLYVGQASLADLCEFLFDYGFELITLRQQGRFEGAAIEFNAFFIKRHELMTDAQIVKSRVWQMLKNVFRSPASMTTIVDRPDIFGQWGADRYLRAYDIEKFEKERWLQDQHRQLPK